MSTFPRLVLLPGLDGTGLLFQPLRKALPAEIQTTAVDYPVDRPLSYDNLMDYIAEKLPRSEPYVLLGESFSGPLAIRLAAQSPVGLCGLVLVVTFARKPIRWLPRWFGPFIPPDVFRLFPTWSQLRLLATGNTDPALKQLFQTALRQVAPRVFARRVGELLRVDVTRELRNLTIPLLILAARHDRIVQKHNWQLLRQLRSEAQFEMIDAGHLLLQTAPEQAAEVLVRFLKQVSSSGV